MAYMLTEAALDRGRFGKGSEHCSVEDRSGSLGDDHHFMFDCPAYSYISQQHVHMYSHLFRQASP